MSTDPQVVHAPPPPPTLPQKLVGVLMWIIGLPWLVGMMGLMMLVGLVWPSHKTNWLTRIYCAGQVHLLLGRYRVVADPSIRADQTYMFAQNHVNLLDHVTMYCSSPHFKQGLENEDHFKIPVYGWFMKQRGTIPVNRKRPDNKARIAAHMRQELDEGRSLLVFPEGSRTRTGRVQAFRPGVFKMAIELGVPIIPTAVTGMFEVLPTPGWVIRPFQTVTVHLCTPLSTDGLTEADAPALAAKAEAAVRGVVDAYYATRETP